MTALVTSRRRARPRVKRPRLLTPHARWEAKLARLQDRYGVPVLRALDAFERARVAVFAGRRPTLVARRRR